MRERKSATDKERKIMRQAYIFNRLCINIHIFIQIRSRSRAGYCPILIFISFFFYILA